MNLRKKILISSNPVLNNVCRELRLFVVAEIKQCGENMDMSEMTISAASTSLMFRYPLEISDPDTNSLCDFITISFYFFTASF